MAVTIIEHLVPHRSSRGRALINCIILHDTGGKTAAGTLAWFKDSRSKVSSHYLIDKDGTTYQCVPDEQKAWHAGSSSLWGVEDVNPISLGIEIVDDNDADPYPDIQIEALITLTAILVKKYRIWLNRIVGHQHVAPGRKVDPGPDFDWENFLLAVAAKRLTEDSDG